MKQPSTLRRNSLRAAGFSPTISQGAEAATSLASYTVKLVALVAVPTEVVTAILPLLRPLGTVALIRVALFAVKLVSHPSSLTERASLGGSPAAVAHRQFVPPIHQVVKRAGVPGWRASSVGALALRHAHASHAPEAGCVDRGGQPHDGARLDRDGTPGRVTLGPVPARRMEALRHMLTVLSASINPNEHRPIRARTACSGRVVGARCAICGKLLEARDPSVAGASGPRDLATAGSAACRGRGPSPPDVDGLAHDLSQALAVRARV